jgi:hypothetical protein
MIQQNAGLKTFTFIFKDLLFDAVYWPIWWYTTGTIESIYRLSDSIAAGNQRLGLTIWIKNIFVPMFGDETWQGRLVSILMRVAQIIVRGFLFVLWLIYSVIIFIGWFILPIFIIYQIIFNLQIII